VADMVENVIHRKNNDQKPISATLSKNVRERDPQAVEPATILLQDLIKKFRQASF
jgi:hypothetical protein